MHESTSKTGSFLTESEFEFPQSVNDSMSSYKPEEPKPLTPQNEKIVKFLMDQIVKKDEEIKRKNLAIEEKDAFIKEIKKEQVELRVEVEKKAHEIAKLKIINKDETDSLKKQIVEMKSSEKIIAKEEPTQDSFQIEESPKPVPNSQSTNPFSQ